MRRLTNRQLTSVSPLSALSHKTTFYNVPGRWAINADASRRFRFSNTTQMDVGWSARSVGIQAAAKFGAPSAFSTSSAALKAKRAGCVEVPGPIPLASGFELRIRFTFRENSRQ